MTFFLLHVSEVLSEKQVIKRHKLGHNCLSAEFISLAQLASVEKLQTALHLLPFAHRFTIRVEL
jgi:hypothetical protein